ncbi:MAG: glycosyltransferase [Acidobacteriia bacterium]|nr:glycosyltransferase [Terriglobia bacterium]
MKIAIMGIRGVPANYGGFETFAEEMGWRLAARGHAVTVYGRSHYVDPHLESYHGIRLRVLPSLRTKYLDTVAHTALSVIDSLGRGFECILICNAANAVFSWIPSLGGTKVVLNVDGLERKRKKWNVLGRSVYRISEWLATWLPSAMVTDAAAIRDYYRARYHAESYLIPYGAAVDTTASDGVLSRLNVEPRKYFLYVSRLEPENNAHLVIQAFERVKTDLKLLIVGDAPYSEEYIRELKTTASKNILFTGAIYGTGYHELQAHALCYLHATEVGGAHPALLEAMGHGNVVIVHDTPENREVVGDAGIIIDMHDEAALVKGLQELASGLSNKDRLRTLAKDRVESFYSWDAITTQYEKLFDSLIEN